MNKATAAFFTAALAVGAAGSSAQTVYTGNGGTGFGGPIGTSTLTVTENGNNIDFSLTTGVPFSGNALVLYLDTTTGGFGDTSLLTDTSDGGRTAISGFNSGNPSRTVATFPATFAADRAITVEPGNFSGMFDLSTPSNFGFVSSGGLSGSGTGPFTFSFSKADLGLTDPIDSFDFVGTLISTSAYRSNETIGTSVTVPGTPGDAPNAGFNGTTTFANFNTFTVVPEPAAVGLLTLGGVALIRRRSR